MRFMRRSAEAAGDQAAWSGPPPLADRGCCCPARPVVRVLIPPSSARPHSVDLLLCGHHYLASRAALAAVNAVAIDETGSVLEPASTEGDMGDLNDADDAAGRWAGAGLIRRPGGSDA
jgi:hypothetical protein